MYQVVVDTNVIVAALLSRPRRVAPSASPGGDGRWKMNLSVPLVLEYEQTLKRVCAGATLTSSNIDDILDFLCASANRNSPWRAGRTSS